MSRKIGLPSPVFATSFVISSPTTSRPSHVGCASVISFAWFGYAAASRFISSS
jgi:hypothetical protein